MELDNEDIRGPSIRRDYPTIKHKVSLFIAQQKLLKMSNEAMEYGKLILVKKYGEKYFSIVYDSLQSNILTDMSDSAIRKIYKLSLISGFPSVAYKLAYGSKMRRLLLDLKQIWKDCDSTRENKGGT